MTILLENLFAVTPQSFVTNSAGENIDVPLQSSLLLVTPGLTNDFISGLIPQHQLDGLMCMVWNIDATKTLLLKQTVNSTSGYRILMPAGLTTLTLIALESVWIVFRQGIGWNVYRPGVFS